MKETRFSITKIFSAVFLLVISAIGPGFLTQTAIYTQNLHESFSFVILLSSIIDIIVQLNIWRVIMITQKRAQHVAGSVFPGLGHLLSLLIFAGGLIFNIGNIAGAGIGINILFPQISVSAGACISALVAIFIFTAKKKTNIFDIAVFVFALILIGMISYIVFHQPPPLPLVLKGTFSPNSFDIVSVITIVGGTVGGYVSFSGAHRLLETQPVAKENKKIADLSAVLSISVASFLRFFLFLAALVVVEKGFTLNVKDPASSIFYDTLGQTGGMFFGIILFVASISSVIGSSYTSISFIETIQNKLPNYRNTLIVLFIIVATALFVLVGKPVKILVYAGAINGMILPIGLFAMLIAANKSSIVGKYKHPIWLSIAGVVTATMLLTASLYVIYKVFI
ncbi:MAG: NRAMP family divalent metal transporter [Pseudomonadota bacterium]